jgi:NAD(P)H-dependent flavin oxidoreductase YrpB (nitropropane dioxygenase family)
VSTVPGDPRLHTPLCDLLGIAHPIVQTGMGWVASGSLAAATSAAGGLGIIGSATMDLDELARAIAVVKALTSNPFGVNLRADASDIDRRVGMLIDEQVRVASFAQAPNQAVFQRLRGAGIVIMPSIGAKRHAEKVLDWGADAVLVQGGEGGGHTGAVATTALLPQVVDVVAGRAPVVAAGGFFDGRGLVAALAYGADGIAMGTRFLLTSDSPVPTVVQREYLARSTADTTVTRQVDGVPHRVIRTPLIDRLESSSGRVTALPRAVANALRFRRLTGLGVGDMVREGLAMRRSGRLTWAQMLMAANTPMLIKASMVDGDVGSGILPSGQIVGLIDDLPSCAELIERIIGEATATLERLER